MTAYRKIRCNHCLKAISVNNELCPFCGGDQLVESQRLKEPDVPDVPDAPDAPDARDEMSFADHFWTCFGILFVFSSWYCSSILFPKPPSEEMNWGYKAMFLCYWITVTVVPIVLTIKLRKTIERWWHKKRQADKEVIGCWAIFIVVVIIFILISWFDEPTKHSSPQRYYPSVQTREKIDAIESIGESLPDHEVIIIGPND